MEVKLQAEEVEKQLMGLGRYCDQMTLEKKIINLVFKGKQKEGPQSPLITQRQEKRMLAIR